MLLGYSINKGKISIPLVSSSFNPLTRFICVFCFTVLIFLSDCDDRRPEVTGPRKVCPSYRGRDDDDDVMVREE